MLTEKRVSLEICGQSICSSFQVIQGGSSSGYWNYASIYLNFLFSKFVTQLEKDFCKQKQLTLSSLKVNTPQPFYLDSVLCL